MKGEVKIVQVHAKSKSYDVLIGNSILSQLERKRDILCDERFAVIISSRVYELYQNYISNIFKDYKNCDILQMQDGEDQKNYKNAEGFLEILLKKGYTRKSVIIDIGGGVVSDFAGFIAAVYMRGIPVIHIPTTLLAMVDSSIGGKVAVNISSGKNIVGIFHQPEMVISDSSFLSTLPENEVKNGITEVLKHALIGDDLLWDIIINNDLNSIMEPDCISNVIFLSAAFKAGIVERDEQESGLRAILNFGHTIGHAIESVMEYSGISHGEAVAIGIKAEMEISRRLGWLSDDEIGHVDDIMKRYQLIYNNYDLNADNVIKHMIFDKKNSDGNVNCVLLKGLGTPVFNQPLDMKMVKDVIIKL